ncbi:hypothetical protein J4Q44_G00127290 [Coregonus suidteri]|uniref:Uncharacterized protein n=1 Tax=Coregonus suidteri TaxID=861788 RepID=A0AAN8QVE7_9TELE
MGRRHRRACRNLPEAVQLKLKEVVGWDRKDDPEKEDYTRHHCQFWKKTKAEEKSKKTGLQTQLQKAQLAALEKSSKPDKLMLSTPAPVPALTPVPQPWPPATTPAQQGQFPPQPYGNPQPFQPYQTYQRRHIGKPRKCQPERIKTTSLSKSVTG